MKGMSCWDFGEDFVIKLFENASFVANDIINHMINVEFSISFIAKSLSYRPIIALCSR